MSYSPIAKRGSPLPRTGEGLEVKAPCDFVRRQVLIERDDLLCVLVVLLELDLAPGRPGEDRPSIRVHDAAIPVPSMVREAQHYRRLPGPALHEDLARLELDPDLDEPLEKLLDLGLP